jgi:hypothetical protein
VVTTTVPRLPHFCSSPSPPQQLHLEPSSKKKKKGRRDRGVGDRNGKKKKHRTKKGQNRRLASPSTASTPPDRRR